MLSFADTHFQQVAFSQTRVISKHRVGDKIDIKVNGNLFTSYILSAFEKYPSSIL